MLRVIRGCCICTCSTADFKTIHLPDMTIHICDSLICLDKALYFLVLPAVIDNPSDLDYLYSDDELPDKF